MGILSLRRIASFAIPVILSVMAWAAETGDGWPLFRGNAQLTGVSSSALPENLKLLWTAKLRQGTESTAAIAGNTVFIADADGYLYAIELHSGKTKWEYKASDEIKSSPTVAGDTVYFGDEKGLFHAVNASDGKAKWTFQADASVISSAAATADSVFFGSYDHHLYSIDAKEGELRWKFETEGNIHATPAVFKENIIIAGCDGYLRIITAAGGKEIAKISLGGYVGSSPALHGDRVFLGTFTNRVLGVNLNAKKLLWEFENPSAQFPFYASAAVTDKFVIIGGRDKILYAFDPSSGKVLWQQKGKARIDSSPVIAGSRVFYANTAGEILAADLSSGREVWKFETGSSIISSPSIAANKLIIGSKDGILYCFGGGAS